MATAVSMVRQQVAPWSQQDKENKQEEELGDWLTFPGRGVVAGREGAAPMVSCVYGAHGAPPGEHPHSHPMGRGHRVEHQCPAGSPKYTTKFFSIRFFITNHKYFSAIDKV